MHGGPILLWTEDLQEEAPTREVDLSRRRNHYSIALWAEERIREVLLKGYS
jgi:hypothetical protein